MTTRPRGRYRAPVRPKTPLTVLSEAVATNAGTVGRRSAVIAASSGLVVTMGLPAAGATPLTDSEPQETTGTLEPVADQARAESVTPDVQVTVDADAQVSFASTTLTEVTAPPPPPPPPPPPAPTVQERSERASSASRSTERAPVSSEKKQKKAAPEAASSGAGIISLAARYVGTPYVYGGTTPAGFDCSGYTQYVYALAGKSIPRTSGAQGAGGRRIPASEARPGDLVWSGNGHIGIYAGGNMMYDAPRSGKAVQKRSIWFTPIFVRY